MYIHSSTLCTRHYPSDVYWIPFHFENFLSPPSQKTPRIQVMPTSTWASTRRTTSSATPGRTRPTARDSGPGKTGPRSPGTRTTTPLGKCGPASLPRRDFSTYERNNFSFEHVAERVVRTPRKCHNFFFVYFATLVSLKVLSGGPKSVKTFNIFLSMLLI